MDWLGNIYWLMLKKIEKPIDAIELCLAVVKYIAMLL